jgi:hypothetical protein
VEVFVAVLIESHREVKELMVVVEVDDQVEYHHEK